MEAPKFTGKNPETHKRLLHMMMFKVISNLVIFIFKKKISSFHGALFLAHPVYTKFKKIMRKYVNTDQIVAAASQCFKSLLKQQLIRH